MTTEEQKPIATAEELTAHLKKLNNDFFNTLEPAFNKWLESFKASAKVAQDIPTHLYSACMSHVTLDMDRRLTRVIVMGVAKAILDVEIAIGEARRAKAGPEKSEPEQ